MATFSSGAFWSAAKAKVETKRSVNPVLRVIAFLIRGKCIYESPLKFRSEKKDPEEPLLSNKIYANSLKNLTLEAMDRFDGKRAANIWFLYICYCKTHRLIFQSLTGIEQIGKTAGSISAMKEGGGVREILGQALANVTNL